MQSKHVQPELCRNQKAKADNFCRLLNLCSLCEVPATSRLAPMIHPQGTELGRTASASRAHLEEDWRYDRGATLKFDYCRTAIR